MKVLAYHRTTATDSSLEKGLQDIQEFAKSAGLKIRKIYTDENIGSAFEMPHYNEMKETMKTGDVLILTDLDMLGRLKKDIVRELKAFRERHIRLMILKYPTSLIDLSSMEKQEAKSLQSAIENLTLEIYSQMADNEAKRRSRNQRAGIQAMRESGEWERYGRKRLMSLEDFGKEYQVVINGELKPFELMHKLNMKIPTFYKYRDEYLKTIGKK